MENRGHNPFRNVVNAMKSIDRNARVMVLIEPLFSIPNTMYAGYLSLYMIAIGLSKAQVGIVSSLGMTASFICASMSAYAADKLGRRRTILVFDTLSWVVAQFIWIVAGNMLGFIIASVINATVQFVGNSFSCLMLEDNEPAKRVHVYNFLQIAGIVAGFFTPIGTALISRFTLVPAVRIMLTAGMILISVQITVRHVLTRETAIGIQKQREMKDVRIWQVFKAYLPVFKRVISNRLLVLILFIRVFNYIQLGIRNTYLSILVTERLGFSPGIMAMFFTLNSVVMLFVLVFITPLLSKVTRRWPIALGICVHIAAAVILLLSPPSANLPLLIVSAILIAVGTGLTTPYVDALAANTIRDEDRAASNSVISMIIMLCSAPFGYIGGLLSELDPRAPFLLTLLLFLSCLALLAAVIRKEKTATE